MIKISKDKSKLNVPMIHDFLSNSYWGKGRTIEQVKKSIENSLCFGVYQDNIQIGFARVASDFTYFVFLMDVFILPEYRGKGFSKQLIKTITQDEQLKDCGRWMLRTADAHGLYKQFGFKNLNNSEMVMERIIE